MASREFADSVGAFGSDKTERFACAAKLRTGESRAGRWLKTEPFWPFLASYG